MLTKLRLKRFKNFEDAELHLGNFTLLVGENASGKSNLRDAFRFIHGISRGYNLAEIMGEKYAEGGVLQWRGMRGGPREIAFQNSPTFELEVSFSINYEDCVRQVTYQIEVDTETLDSVPRAYAESLLIEGCEDAIFKSKHFHITSDISSELGARAYGEQSFSMTSLPSYRPVLSQIVSSNFTNIFPRDKFLVIREIAQKSLDALSDMRFLDFNPEAMRLPSFPGQTVLGDRGENLSSVLQNICADSQRKQALIQWVQELTPMDAADFEFSADFTGRILLTLIEAHGQKTSAITASDGTLRFLAMIAALLEPEPAQFYFFEELDNGIHPTRLNLLLQLIDRQLNKIRFKLLLLPTPPNYSEF
jgi:predicted ATPase